jgi:hypothetical protein
VEEREQRLVALQAQSKHEVEAANAPAQVAMKERDDLKAELERGERERLNLTHDIGHGIMRKYGLEICRQCYRESAANIGFENVRRLVRQRIYVLFWRSNEVLRCLLLFASFSFLSVFMNCAPLFRARLFSTDNKHASSLFPSAVGVNCALLQILRKSSLSRDGHRRSRWPNVCCRLGRHLQERDATSTGVGDEGWGEKGDLKYMPESFKELPIPRVHVGVELLKAGAQHFFCFADFSQSNLKHGHKQAAHYNSNNSNPSNSSKTPHASPRESRTRSNSCSLFSLRSCPHSLALSFSPYMLSSGSSRLQQLSGLQKIQVQVGGGEGGAAVVPRNRH